MKFHIRAFFAYKCHILADKCVNKKNVGLYFDNNVLSGRHKLTIEHLLSNENSLLLEVFVF
jgi:hypothetical protein